MLSRRFVFVETGSGVPKVKHFHGLPPEVDAHKTGRYLMPPARVLVIEREEDGSYLLFRFASDRTVAGDTWHETLDDAYHQAKYEYGVEPDSWREAPPDVEDVVDYAFSILPKGASQ